MTDWLSISLLYLVGCCLLIIELFLPAHGLLGLVGMGMIGFGLYETYGKSEVVGLISMVVLAILLPTGLVLAVKHWHGTPVGRRISPPNPELTDSDRMPVEYLKPLIGTVGKSLTLLRPVGTCEFDGQRVECTAEYGMIERNVEVEAIRLVDRTVSVRPVSPPESASPPWPHWAMSYMWAPQPVIMPRL